MTQERLAFGVTVNQFDQLIRLLRTITANGDVMTVGGAESLHRHTVSVLGEGIFEAALEVQGVLDEVEEQRLPREPRTASARPHRGAASAS